MKVKKIKYPLYYEVDDVPIILEEDGNDVVGHCANGQPYPIGKAIVEGHQVTRTEYNKLTKKLYGIELSE